MANSYEKLRSKALSDEAALALYDALETENEVGKVLLLERKKQGLTQSKVAEKMGTTTSVVSRLEKSLMDGRHSPSLSTLKSYADALGLKLKITIASKSTS